MPPLPPVALDVISERVGMPRPCPEPTPAPTPVPTPGPCLMLSLSCIARGAPCSSCSSSFIASSRRRPPSCARLPALSGRLLGYRLARFGHRNLFGPGLRSGLLGQRRLGLGQRHGLDHGGGGSGWCSSSSLASRGDSSSGCSCSTFGTGNSLIATPSSRHSSIT